MFRSLLTAAALACVLALGGTAAAQAPAKPATGHPAVVAPTFKPPHKPGNPGPLPPGTGSPVPGHSHRHRPPVVVGKGHHYHPHHAWRFNKWHHGHHVPVVRVGWPTARWYGGHGWYSFPQAAYARGYCYIYRFSPVYQAYAWVPVAIPAWYVPVPVTPVPVVPIDPNVPLVDPSGPPAAAQPPLPPGVPPMPPAIDD